jgi:hypothetical protein
VAKHPPYNAVYRSIRFLFFIFYTNLAVEVDYPTTKSKVYSEEEGRHLLCRLNYYGMNADNIYECIKKDITVL